MKRVVIVGSSGMVGGYALRYALQNPSIEQVVSVGRKRLSISHPNLNEVLHPDFADCSALAEALSGLHAAVFCIGTYTGAVSATEMRKITVDHALEFARVRASSPEATFAFLIGNGADPTGRSRTAFARNKGAAEKGLRAAGFPRLYLFRPAYIYPVEPRKEPTLSYRLLRAVYPAFRIFFPGLSIRSDDLGRVMVDLSVQDTAQPESRVLENRDIQRWPRRRSDSFPLKTAFAV
jgi:uncharacterized protein YbjT (DUF2867 family)